MLRNTLFRRCQLAGRTQILSKRNTPCALREIDASIVKNYWMDGQASASTSSRRVYESPKVRRTQYCPQCIYGPTLTQLGGSRGIKPSKRNIKHRARCSSTSNRIPVGGSKDTSCETFTPFRVCILFASCDRVIASA